MNTFKYTTYHAAVNRNVISTERCFYFYFFCLFFSLSHLFPGWPFCMTDLTIQVLWSHDVHRYSRYCVTIYNEKKEICVAVRQRPFFFPPLRLSYQRLGRFFSLLCCIVYVWYLGWDGCSFMMRQKSQSNLTEHFWINYYCM